MIASHNTPKTTQSVPARMTEGGPPLATRLRIMRVRIRTGAGWQRPYNLDSAIVVVWGPVETGKTSLLDAIAFVLGCDVQFHGAVDLHVREVEITIEIGDAVHTLRRARKTKSMVTVLDPTGTPRELPLAAGPDQQSLSSWLLHHLGMDEALASVRLPGGRSLTFPTGVLPYCYLTQDHIDRHIIMPRSADAARIAVLKLALNLTTAEYERICGEILDADNELRRHRERAHLIEGFLDGSPATNLNLLDAQIAEFTQEHTKAVERLQGARDRAAAVTLQDAHYEKLLQQASTRWADAEARLDTARNDLAIAERRARGYEVALRELREMETRPPWRPGAIKRVLEHCPICNSAVPHEPPKPGQCYLCGALRCGVIQPGERHRLETAKQAADTAHERLHHVFRTIEEQAEHAKHQVHELRRRRDLQTQSAVPLIGAVEDAAGQAASIEGQLHSLIKTRESAARVHDMREQIRRLEQHQQQRRDRQVLNTAGLSSPEEVISTLSAILTGVIDQIELPHWTRRARIHPDTFLPIIDTRAFEQRGLGARSAVSIAYSLTLLTHALERPEVKLPGLLMIDSPGKNLGTSKSDQKIADRLYEQILDYLQTWSTARAAGDRPPFQIIIVDSGRRQRQAAREGTSPSTPPRHGVTYMGCR